MEATTAPTSQATDYGTTTVAALYEMYHSIRENHPELPASIMVVTGSGISARGLTWGHFRADSWVAAQKVQVRNLCGVRLKFRVRADRMPEMFISGERLDCGAELTLQTMLHECAHVIANLRGIKDCGANGRHNKEFLKVAQEMGLTYPHDKACSQLGYSAVVLTEKTKSSYAPVIDALSEAISASMDTMKRLGLTTGTGSPVSGPDNGHGVATIKAPRQGKDRNYVKMVCACGDIIRKSAKNAAKANTMCGDCGERYEIA